MSSRLRCFVLCVALMPPIATAIAAEPAPLATSAGHSFIAPEGFAMTTQDHEVVFKAPEGDATIAIVDVDASNADEAVAKGWATVRPDFALRLKLSTPRPARNGWVDQRYDEYETSPNEKSTVFALARHSSVAPGKAWIAIVVDTEIVSHGCDLAGITARLI